jgi:hypothetical protein
MAFHFRFGTSKEPISGKLKVVLKSPYFSRELAFPPPGNLAVQQFAAPPEAVFDLHCSFYVDDDRAGVRIERIGGSDSLSVVACPHTRPKVPGPAVLFAGTVWHASAQEREHCTVVCDDGTEGECCVTCQEGRSVTKICC